MKKTVALFLTLSMCLSTMAIFTACDSHTHSHESDWTCSSTHHWFACEEDSCTDTKQKSEHVFIDGACAVCGFRNGSSNITNNNSSDVTDNNSNNPSNNTNNNTNNNNNNINNNSNNNSLPISACAYKVVSAPMSDGMIVMDSFKAGNANYYYVDLGYAENIPIWNGITVNYNQNQGTSPVLTLTKEMHNESSVEQSISSTLTKTVSQSFTTSNSVQVGGEIGVEIDAEFLKASKSYNVSYEHSRTWGNSHENQNSTSSAFSTTKTIAESYATSGTFSTGGCGYGYYRLSILATCDIYALIKTDSTNSEILSVTYAFCPRENAALSIEFSPDNTWTDNTATKINITQSAINSLPAPKTVYDKYLGETYTTSATPSTTQSGEHIKKVYEHTGKTSFTVSVPSELKRFMDMGWLYVEVTATCNSSLKYRSNKYAATATIKAAFGDNAYTKIDSFEAIGGGWPWSYVDPAYGDEVTKSSTLSNSFAVTSDSIFMTLNYYYLVDFGEYKNWAGGTNAVTYQFNMNQIEYKFYIDDSK